MEPEKVYKGYKIWRNTKSVNKKNKDSGHEWTEDIPLNTFYLSGPHAAVTQSFKSIEAAEDHVDFLIFVRGV